MYIHSILFQVFGQCILALVKRWLHIERISGDPISEIVTDFGNFHNDHAGKCTNNNDSTAFAANNPICIFVDIYSNGTILITHDPTTDPNAVNILARKKNAKKK